MTNPYTVCVHAWAFTAPYVNPNDGLWDLGQEYADADGGDPHDGWTVYVREERGPGDFDVVHAEDFDTKEQALAKAAVLSVNWGDTPAPIQEY